MAPSEGGTRQALSLRPPRSPGSLPLASSATWIKVFCLSVHLFSHPQIGRSSLTAQKLCEDPKQLYVSLRTEPSREKYW